MDTIQVIDIYTGLAVMEVVTNRIDPADIQRYRLQEIWYFDEVKGRVQVRIIGIAPLRNVYDEVTGAFRYEQPLFWIHYPSSRSYLAKHAVFNPNNDAEQIT